MRSQVSDLKPLQVSGMKGFASHCAPETAVSWGGVCMGTHQSRPGESTVRLWVMGCEPVLPPVALLSKGAETTPLLNVRPKVVSHSLLAVLQVVDDSRDGLLSCGAHRTSEVHEVQELLQHFCHDGEVSFR